MTATDWIVSYLARWLPHSSPTGLFAIGTPDRESPVIVTANFSLTVHRVRKALQGQNAWLLVANTGGINVWCASVGGGFTEKQVIDAIKISRLAEKIDNRKLILPNLSASGIDCDAIKRETGFQPRFGPVQAKDIVQYLDSGEEKTDQMKRFNFNLKHRMDMLVSMNFIPYMLVAGLLAIFGRSHIPVFSAIYWGAVTFLYLFVNFIPGKTGWAQAFYLAILLSLSWAGVDWIVSGNPLKHWGWLIAVFGIFFTAGFDAAGIVSPRKSDAENMMYRLGFRKLGSLYSAGNHGQIDLKRDRCTGCRSCDSVCPVGVYGELDGDHKTTFLNRDACFACGACVKQCPEEALSLK